MKGTLAESESLPLGMEFASEVALEAVFQSSGGPAQWMAQTDREKKINGTDP